MGTTPGPAGPAQVPEWVLHANAVIERLYLLLRINVLWMALTLLGLVVLGLAPATVAAVDALLESKKGAAVRVLPMMWRTYRAQLIAANTRLLPLHIVQVGALTTLVLAFSGAIASAALMVVAVIGAGISLAWTTAALAALLASPRLRRQDLLVCYRIALLIPGALPLRAIGLVLLAALWSLLSVVIAPLGVLVGAAAALDLAVGMFGRSTDELLARIDEAQSSRA